MAVPSGGRHGGPFGDRGVQVVQRTGRGADFAGGDTQITGRGVQAAMPQQQLNGTQIGTGLQQVNGECKRRLSDVLGLPEGVIPTVQSDDRFFDHLRSFV
jgi:hypothetical protein